jgi:hypothetical protein
VIKEIEEILNVDALQKFLESEETDMMMLWTKMVDRIEGREEIGISITVTPDPVEFKETVGSTGDTNPEPKKKAGRPKKPPNGTDSRTAYRDLWQQLVFGHQY